jgi:hypothetical protein
MNVLESKLATTHDLFTLAKLRGVDLSSTSQDWAFLNDGRFISLWRTVGEVHYNLQGPIKELPERTRPRPVHFEVCGMRQARLWIWIRHSSF